MTDNALDFLPLGKLNYPMRDRWRPSRVTLPVCKWAAGPEWKWRPLTGKMREQPLWPTWLARLIICPCNHTQPRSSLILLVSESLCLAMLLEDAATQLDASGNLSRASNLPSSIKPTFPILNSFHKFDLEVKKSGLSDIYFKSNV